MEAAHDLELIVRARHPLLAVETWEEERLETMLRRVAAHEKLPLHIWTVSEGIQRQGVDSRRYDTRDPEKALQTVASIQADAVWLFKDLHRYLDRPEVVRALRDIAAGQRGARCRIVLAGPKLKLPAELEKVTVRFRLALPDQLELGKLVHEVVRELGQLHKVRVDLDDQHYRRLLEGLKGLTLFEAERAVTEAVLDDMALTAADVHVVQRAKRDLIAKGGVLEYVPHREDAPALGGLGAFKAWIQKRDRALSQEAKDFGLPAPKGVVLLGVQGCGKSMAARAVADAWSLPLLKLEAGRLYDMYIGESEKNLEEAIWLAEHMAPCVLLIDEIEKGFSSGGGGTSDGGLSKRILGRLLGWLQEREKPVFVVATCNAVKDLPPELLRKGRFDEIFFVDLPVGEERIEILRLHLAMRDRDPNAFDLEVLADVSDGFSGAELEQAIVSALYTAFSANQKLSTELLEAEITSTRPLSVTRSEDIEALRSWAKERAVSAR